MPDDRTRGEAPQSPLETTVIRSDGSIAKIEITTRDHVHVVRSKIIAWNMARGAFDGLSAAQVLFFFSLVHNGEPDPNSAGLVVRRHPRVLQRSVGRGRGGFYTYAGALEAAVMIRRWREAYADFDTYEVFLPPPPDEVIVPTSEHAGMLGQRALRADSAQCALEPELALPDQEPYRRAWRADSAPCAPTSMPACSLARMARQPVHHHNDDYDDHHDDALRGGGEEGKTAGDVELKLRSLRFDGLPLDQAGIRALLKSKNCTLPTIEAALTITAHYHARAKQRGKKFDPLRYCCALIRDGCTAPPTPEQRREAAKPDHVQEDNSVMREARAAAAAAEQRQAERLKQLPPARLAELVDQIIALAPSPFLAKFYADHRAKPLDSLLMKSELVKLLDGPATPLATHQEVSNAQ